MARTYSCSRIQFGRSVTDAALAGAKDAGMICNLFYSDEPEEAKEYLRRGVDVVLTNVANRLMETVRTAGR